MGEVFRARDERLGRDVALKLIRPASNANPDHRHRFELEARVVSALNHPNIVAIYDVGFHNGSPYIVSELLEGQTLRKRLTEGALPVRLAADYSLQIVQGLIAAHDRQITHRDLKPENLFLTTDGRVKILDFGLAKLQPESERPVEELTTITMAGVLVGTPSYMSPEQVRRQKVDHRSDLFSMGSILYEMLTGRRTFKGETELDTMIAVAAKYPLRMDEGIPFTLREIVRYCLEKEPKNRFQSARDLAVALDFPSTASDRVMLRYGVIDLDRRVEEMSDPVRWVIDYDRSMEEISDQFRRLVKIGGNEKVRGQARRWEKIRRTMGEGKAKDRSDIVHEIALKLISLQQEQTWLKQKILQEETGNSDKHGGE